MNEIPQGLWFSFKEEFLEASVLSSPDTTAAIVLVGGRSVRMGREKSLLTVRNEPFLTRICRLVAPLCSPVIVVAAENQQLPDCGTDVDVVRDTLPDAGPLAGLLSGLEALHRMKTSARQFWLAGCDAPFVSPTVIRRLLASSGDSQAVLIEHQQRTQPLGGVYRTDILPVVRELIETGERRLSQLPPRLRCVQVDAESLRDLDPELAFLRNINTPEDYQRFVVDS